MPANRAYVGRQVLLMAGLNAACLITGIVMAILLRLGAGQFEEYFWRHISDWIYFVGAVILANYVSGGFGIQLKVSRFNLVVDWAFSLVVAMVLVSTVAYAWFELSIGRGVFFITVAIYSALWLSVMGLLYSHVFRNEPFIYRVGILGRCPEALELERVVTSKMIRPAHRVAAVFDFEGAAPADASDRTMESPLVICRPEELPALVKKYRVEALLIGNGMQSKLINCYAMMRRLRYAGVTVMDALSAYEVYTGRIPLELVDDAWLVQASVRFSSPMYGRFKRVFDVVMALVLLLVFSPVLALVALAIKVGEPRSPILFRQIRVGRYGRPFTMYKLRTMRAVPGQAPAVWSPVGDPRVTRLGRLLRRFRVDEIPQLVNVLRGDMSLVGPRPEQADIAATLERDVPWYREREHVLPGLTGWAQIRHPYGATVDDARRKLEYDLYYISNLSFALDVRIVLNTIRIMLLGMERRAP